MKLTRLARRTRDMILNQIGWGADYVRSKRDPEAARFFQAFMDVRRRALSIEERAWFSKVEALRRELKHSTRRVSFFHYGLGARDERAGGIGRTEGRLVECAVSDLVDMSFDDRWALILFRLIRSFKPESCLEIGTCIGISALFQASALELNRRGNLITLEGAPSLAELAVENFSRLGLDRVDVTVGRFQDVLPSALERHKPFDYVFVDGDHFEESTVDHFERLRPCLADGAVLVFDDISFSPGMRRAWKRIAQSAAVARSFDLGRLGVCLVSASTAGRRDYRIIV